MKLYLLGLEQRAEACGQGIIFQSYIFEANEAGQLSAYFADLDAETRFPTDHLLNKNRSVLNKRLFFFFDKKSKGADHGTKQDELYDQPALFFNRDNSFSAQRGSALASDAGPLLEH